MVHQIQTLELLGDKDYRDKDGLHFTVDHRNHGMHHETNRVTISGVELTVPTKLTLPYGANLLQLYLLTRLITLQLMRMLLLEQQIHPITNR